MNIVLIDSSTAGISGDKLLTALVNLGIKPEYMQAEISKAIKAAARSSKSSVKFVSTKSKGIQGTMMSIKLDKTPLSIDELRSAKDRAADALKLSRWGRDVSSRALEEIISSETAVHGQPHLHEIGELDTIVDIIGTVKAAEALELENSFFFTTPVAVGCGSVESAHGILPIPAPSTAKILMKAGIPIFSTDRLGELTTPTGAALLAALTGGKHEPPPTVYGREGIGIGTRQFPFPNITRVFVGVDSEIGERIQVLETNVDDVSGEVLGWLQERLQGQAEDVSILPMITKKSRPGFCVRVVVMPEKAEAVKDILINETGTFGVKIFECLRHKVPRKSDVEKFNICGRSVQVRIKRSENGRRVKPEFEDLKRVALQEGIPLREVEDEVLRQVRQKYEKGKISNGE